MKADASLPNRRARLPWALVPVALLLSSALGVGSMAVIAARDPHFATEADYYKKAISWDQAQAQAASNQRLGYVVELPAIVRFDAHGRATVDLTVRDRLGQPVTGAQLSASAFANAYSGSLIRAEFAEQSGGHYRAELTVSHPGQWVFAIVGNVGGQRFTADLRADLLPGGAA
ncbi:MAG TPA: FixH family protein [Polyangiaceae bacterium]|nr:FixH family protein [Polyangiaceae bacterium]